MKYSTNGAPLSDGNCGCQGNHTQGIAGWQDDLFGAAKSAVTNYTSSFAPKTGNFPANGMPTKEQLEEAERLKREFEENLKRQSEQQKAQEAGMPVWVWLLLGSAAIGMFVMSGDSKK